MFCFTLVVGSVLSRKSWGNLLTRAATPLCGLLSADWQPRTRFPDVGDSWCHVANRDSSFDNWTADTGDRDLEVISSNPAVESPCWYIRRHFPTSWDCSTYGGAWMVFHGERNLYNMGRCWSGGTSCRYYFGNIPQFVEAHFNGLKRSREDCLRHDRCVILDHALEMIARTLKVKTLEACLACQFCESSVPFKLQPFCTNDASDASVAFSAVAFSASQNRTTSNGHLAGFSLCAIQQDIREKLNPARETLPSGCGTAKWSQMQKTSSHYTWIVRCFSWTM